MAAPFDPVYYEHTRCAECGHYLGSHDGPGCALFGTGDERCACAVTVERVSDTFVRIVA